MLPERKQKILVTVVEQYIATGEPIGSKVVCDLLDVHVSSATVRNEMADLVSLGYLEQPHTSAGRVPTQKGYRYYVDNLMEVKELNQSEKRMIEAGVDNRTADPEQLLSKAGEALVDFTKCAALSTTPADENAVIRRIEMVGISSRTAMVVMLTSTGMLKSKPCRCETEINQDLKNTFDRIVEEHFIGRPLCEIGTVMIQTLVASLGAKALSMSSLLVTIADLASSASQVDVQLKGQSNLLNYSDYGDNVPLLLDFLHRSEPINELVSQTNENDDDIEVLIGDENRYDELKNSSMIISKYKIDGGTGGAIGIIGPTRMNYSKIIPSIKYLTDIVSKLLSDVLKEDNDGGDNSDDKSGG